MFNILKRIFIGVAIALCVWFIKSTCFALTVSSYQSRLQWNANGTTSNGSYVDSGTAMTISVPSSSSTEYDLTRLFVRWYVNTNGFSAGSTYSFIFSWTSNPIRPFQDVSGIRYSFTSGSFGQCSTTYSTTDSAFTTTCNVTFDQSLSYLTIGIIPGFPRLTNGSTYRSTLNSNYTIRNVGDDTNEAIFAVGQNLGSQLDVSNEHTSNISSKTNIIANYIEEMRNLLVPLLPSMEFEMSRSADWLQDIYDLIGTKLDMQDSYTDSSFTQVDPRTTDYQSQHNSLSSAGSSGTGSNGSGGLDFGTGFWRSGSTAIWNFITNFLSLSTILIPYLFAILTLGFVKVVLNR